MERENDRTYIHREGSVDDETSDGINVVDVVIITVEAGDVQGGDSGSLLVDLVVLAVVGVGSETLVECVAGIPVGGEVDARGVDEVLVAADGGGAVGNQVLAEAGLLVCADGTALVARAALCVEEFGVDATHDIESVAVISSHEDKGVIQLANGLEVAEGGLDGVVELEKLTEGTVVVQHVHHLVDAGGLGHQEESIVGVTGMENLESLEGHLLETWLVGGAGVGSIRGSLGLVEVLGVHVTIEPLGHVADGEDTQSLGGVGRRFESSVVQNNRVVLLGELGIVVLALEGFAVGVELLGTTTKKNIRAGPIGPGEVGDSVEEGVDHGAILTSVAGMGSESRGRGVGDERRRNNTNATSPDTVENLGNGFDLGIVEHVL